MIYIIINIYYLIIFTKSNYLLFSTFKYNSIKKNIFNKKNYIYINKYLFNIFIYLIGVNDKVIIYSILKKQK